MDLLLVVLAMSISVIVSMPIGYFLGYRESKKPIAVNVRKVALNPGDTLVLSTDGIISDEVAQRLKTHCESHFPGHKCLVFGDGLKLDVLGPDETGGCKTTPP